MKLRIAAACLAAAAATPAVSAAGAASNQISVVPVQYVAPAELPPHDVRAILYSMGLRPIGRPLLWGGYYLVRAIDRHGEFVRVVIDARRGRVVSLASAASSGRSHGERRRFGSLGPRFDDDDDDDDEEDWPASPRAFPGARGSQPPSVIMRPPASVAPPRMGRLPAGEWRPRPPRRIPDARRPLERSAAVVPARPPLPRPRPIEAPAAASSAPGAAPAPDQDRQSGPQDFPPVAPLL